MPPKAVSDDLAYVELTASKSTGVILHCCLQWSRSVGTPMLKSLWRTPACRRRGQARHGRPAWGRAGSRSGPGSARRGAQGLPSPARPPVVRRRSGWGNATEWGDAAATARPQWLPPPPPLPPPPTKAAAISKLHGEPKANHHVVKQKRLTGDSPLWSAGRCAAW